MKNIAIVLSLLLVFFIFWSYHPDLPAAEVETAYANADSQFLMVGGVRLHVRDQGPKTAPAVLLIHGFSSSLHAWEGWANRLDKEFRIIRLDLPGHGLTGPVEDGDYSLGRILNMIDALRTRLGIERWAVVGNSLGGLISWSYAVMHPDRTERLILVDSAGFPRANWPLAIRAARMPVITALFGKLTPRALIANNLKQVFHHDERVTDALITRYHVLIRRAGNRTATATLMQQPEANLLNPEKLKALTLPVLLLWGEKDPWVPLSELAKFKAVLPQAQIITYPDLGHIPMEEDPDRTAADARIFLKTQ